MPQKNNSVTVSGKVILSTIETMESLGRIGEDILRSHGITKIEEDRQYPYELRNSLHKAAIDRFGEIALRAFGFQMGDQLSSLWINELADKAKLLDSQFESKSTRKNSKALETFISLYSEKVNSFFKLSFSSNENLNYGQWYEKKADTVFSLKVTTAFEIYQEPFLSAIQDYVFTKCVGTYWSYEKIYQKEKSHSGYGYATWHWDFYWKKLNKKRDANKAIANIKSDINKNLMTAVLNDAEAQKTRVENLSNQLSKFLPPQIHDALISGNHSTVIATRRKKLTIFFSDIKNFTPTSEGLQPEDLTKYLNEYFSEMTAIALGFGATIDKYIGDAMMVFFGDPETKGEREDARACVEMALKMQDRMKEIQIKWRNQGFNNPFQIRVGINTGYCNVGNFGSNQRLSYTIIGSEVNVAQRLESMADADGILLSYETYAHVQDMVDATPRPALKMKGINRDVQAFSVSSKKDPSHQALAESTNVPPHRQNVSVSTDLPKVLAEVIDALENIRQRVAELEKKNRRS